jgi:hypothetical protein
MFIDSTGYKVLRSNGAKSKVRPTDLPVHCAPLERQTIVARAVYKHLAPLEPDNICSDLAAPRLRSGLFVAEFAAGTSNSPMA